eukprot:1104570-Rhodomonas_salina.1
MCLCQWQSSGVSSRVSLDAGVDGRETAGLGLSRQDGRCLELPHLMGFAHCETRLGFVVHCETRREKRNPTREATTSAQLVGTSHASRPCSASCRRVNRFTLPLSGLCGCA